LRPRGPRFLRHLIADTIAGRTIAVLFTGLVIFHLASIWTYQIGINSEIDTTNEARLAERLYTIKRAVEQLPADERENLAHSLSGGPLEVHWSAARLTAEGTSNIRDTGLRDRLYMHAPELTEDGIIFSAQTTGNHRVPDPHLIFASLRLDDGTWVNFSVTKFTGPNASVVSTVLSTSLMALGVLGASIFILMSVTRPLRACAEAAESLYRGAEPRPIKVAGPREVRHLAMAFNRMQDRVKRLVDDRTLMLAAISHDLKSPLARLSLRSEGISDANVRHPMSADIAEMLAMIDSVLDFLKGDFAPSEVRSLNVAAMLDSICNDWQDAGKTVELRSSGNTVLRGRPLALKRAFSNLIDNAIKYGSVAAVEATGGPEDITIIITDGGPGIPEVQRDAVFAPFFRGEVHRDPEVGGAGLGLTVARTVIRAHGGDIVLGNGREGGLQVSITLPKSYKIDAQK
jgi:two-component system OmpR family sensor kinase